MKTENNGWTIRNNGTWRLLNRGDKVTYTKHYRFGKTGQVTAKVVMIKGQTALLDNGDTTSKFTLNNGDNQC